MLNSKRDAKVRWPAEIPRGISRYAASAALFCMSFALLVSAGEPAPAKLGAGVTRPLHAIVSQEGIDSFSISLDHGLSATIDGQKPGHERLSTEAVLFEVVALEKGLRISTDDQDLAIKAAECSDWLATLPKGNELLLRINSNAGSVALLSPTTNAAPVHVKLCDGAWADIKPGSMVHFEQLNDGSYYLAAVGNVVAENEDGKKPTRPVSSSQPKGASLGYLMAMMGEVIAEDADGRKMVLTANTLPLTGGPLIESTGPDGKPMLRRANPLTKVVVTGDPHEEVTVVVGGQTIDLKSGQKQQVQLANGSIINLSLNSMTSSFEWTVERGEFEIQVQGIEGWQATGVGGASASQQWNNETHTISLRNQSEIQGNSRLDALSYILISPNGTLLARVDRGGTLQISQLDGPNVFATSAAGSVVMVNKQTGKEESLSERNEIFVNGRSATGQKWSSPVGAVHRVEIKGGPGGIQLEANGKFINLPLSSSETLETDSGATLSAQVADKGLITLKAAGGKFIIFIYLDSRLGIKLEPGSEIFLTIDSRAGVAAITGSANNKPGGASFNLAGNGDAGEGAGVELGPNNKLTITLAKTGSFGDEKQGRIFFEGAGAGTGDTAIAPIGGTQTPGPGGNVNNPLDTSRIGEVPLSNPGR